MDVAYSTVSLHTLLSLFWCAFVASILKFTYSVLLAGLGGRGGVICRTCQMTFDWTMLDISKSTARRVAVTYARKILCTNARTAIGGFMLTGAKCVNFVVYHTK